MTWVLFIFRSRLASPTFVKKKRIPVSGTGQSYPVAMPSQGSASEGKKGSVAGATISYYGGVSRQRRKQENNYPEERM